MGLHSRLSSSSVQLWILNVENIYETNSQGDKNANIWFDAEQIDDSTRSQVKKVRLQAVLSDRHEDVH